MKRFIVLIFIVVLSSACSAKASNNSMTVDTNDIIPIDRMEWVKLYDNVDQLIDASELIVTGEVIKVETLMVEELVFTKQTVQVIRTIKGHVVAKDTIDLLRTGGEFDGHKTKYLAGDPILENNKVYLLFLTRYGDEKVSYYVTTGAYQGSAILKADHSMVPQVSYDSVNKELEQLTLDEIIQKVK